MSRSHVSRQVSSLEKQTCCNAVYPQFTRTPRLTPTWCVIVLTRWCEQALDNIDQALIAAVDDVEEVRGDIKVNCVGGYLGEVIIADLVNEFMQLSTQISASAFDFSSNRVDLIEDAFDIAFRMGSLEDAGHYEEAIGHREGWIDWRPEYFKPVKESPIHPKERSITTA